MVPRDEPGRFDDLLSEADVERLVCSTAIRYPAFRLVREGGQLAVGAYTSDVSWRPPFTATADVPRVLAEWEAGATIVLQALHVNWHPLAVFCRLLEAALGHAVQANAYYTPSGSQGFGVHHDTHDVLVLQVAGTKRWRLYDPLLEPPLKHQRYSRTLGEHGPPTDELELRAGDTLYLPRGWLHEAETSSTDSLHLTIGITAYTWLDAVKDALAECEDELAFRRGADGTGGGPRASRAPRRAARPRGDRAPPKARLVDSRRPIREDGLSQLRALERLGVDSLLERRETVIADLEQRDGAVALAFEGRVALPRARRQPSSRRASRARSRSGSPTSRAGSTRKAGSSSCGASSARASCASRAEHAVAHDVAATGAARLRRPARQVGRLVGVGRDDVDLVDRRARRSKRTRVVPSPTSLRAEEREIADAEEPGGLADRLLGGLDRERVGAAAAEAVEVHAPGGVSREEGTDVLRPDATVVEAVREHDDVPGEAVSADVARLPDAAGVGLLDEGVVERPPVPRAAAVALAVRADDEERALHSALPGRRPRRARREVELAEILLMLDLELEEPLLARGVALPKNTRRPASSAALGLPHEEDARVPERVALRLAGAP